MFAPGQVDHAGREVDAERVDAEFAQVRVEVAGPAAEVGDRPAAQRAHAVREHVERGAQIWLGAERVPHHVGVAGRHGVVGGPGVGEPVHGDHGMPTLVISRAETR
jgi:hypothetical protein